MRIRPGVQLLQGPLSYCAKILLAILPIDFYSQVYSIVDEMFLAGELRETSQTKVGKE